MKKKRKKIIQTRYNKTPIIIKEVLGEETYNLIEEQMNKPCDPPKYIIYTSKENKERFEKIFMESFKTTNNA